MIITASTPTRPLVPGMLVAAALMLLGIGFLPGFSLAVPMHQSLPLVLIATGVALLTLGTTKSE